MLIRSKLSSEFVRCVNSPRTWNVHPSTHSRGKSIKSAIIPQNILLDSFSCQAIALYIGDGKRSGKHHIECTSIDIDLVRLMREFFEEYLLISPKRIFLYCRYQDKLPDADIVSVESGVCSSRIKFYARTSLSKPSFALQVASTVHKELMDYLYDVVPTLSLSLPLSKSFLQGLFAAEGCINYNRSERYLVSLSFYLHYKEAKLARRVLYFLKAHGVAARMLFEKKNSLCIRITRWKNYFACYRMQLFDVSDRKLLFSQQVLARTNFSMCSSLLAKKIQESALSQRKIARQLDRSPVTLSLIK